MLVRAQLNSMYGAAITYVVIFLSVLSCNTPLLTRMPLSSGDPSTSNSVSSATKQRLTDTISKIHACNVNSIEELLAITTVNVTDICRDLAYSEFDSIITTNGAERTSIRHDNGNTIAKYLIKCDYYHPFIAINYVLEASFIGDRARNSGVDTSIDCRIIVDTNNIEISKAVLDNDENRTILSTIFELLRNDTPYCTNMRCSKIEITNTVNITRSSREYGWRCLAELVQANDNSTGTQVFIWIPNSDENHTIKPLYDRAEIAGRIITGDHVGNGG